MVYAQKWQGCLFSVKLTLIKKLDYYKSRNCGRKIYITEKTTETVAIKQVIGSGYSFYRILLNFNLSTNCTLQITQQTILPSNEACSNVIYLRK